jgi:hypothetical protein
MRKPGKQGNHHSSSPQNVPQIPSLGHLQRPDANGPRVSLCVGSGRRTPATKPSSPTQMDRAVHGDPFAVQIWAQNVSTQTRVHPPLLLPGPTRQRHQGQSTPKPHPPLLALSPEPYCAAAARPDPRHICCPPFELLLAGAHSSVPASPRAAAGNTARPVHHPLPRPRPPATTPRTFSSNCQANFEVQQVPCSSI